MDRKRYPKEFKDQLIREAQEVGNASQVARRHGIDQKMLNRWVRESKHKAWEQTPESSKKITEYTPSSQEFRKLEEENERL